MSVWAIGHGDDGFIALYEDGFCLISGYGITAVVAMEHVAGCEVEKFEQFLFDKEWLATRPHSSCGPDIPEWLNEATISGVKVLRSEHLLEIEEIA